MVSMRKNHVRDICHGFAFGVANIIPGVSGGTLALVLGFYERLLSFLNRVDVTTGKELLALKLQWVSHPLDRQKFRNFFWRLHEDDWGFIGRIALGAVVAILGLAKVMDGLLNNHFALTYAFFFGLILLSIQVPWNRIRSKHLNVWISLALGVVITIGIAAAVNPAEKAERKSDLYRAQTETSSVGEAPEGHTGDVEGSAFSFSGKYLLTEYLLIFLAGMVAISAMVLPGISGSLMMILMGQYFILIRAVSSLLSGWLLDDMLFLGCCVFGMAIGILLTARLVERALRSMHDVTMAFLTGLIVGSLYALWPFKEMVVLDEVQRDGSIWVARNIASNINRLPDTLAEGIPVLIVMSIGAAVMCGLLKLEADGEDSTS
jgi:putative membrane protein